MDEKLPIFSVDWEEWFCAIHKPWAWDLLRCRIEEPTNFILSLLRKHKINAIFYCVGWCIDKHCDLCEYIMGDHHEIGDHTMYHSEDEQYRIKEYFVPHYHPFRSPCWKNTKMPFPPSGGFFFRIMPIWYLKWAIKKSGVFWIHPHDLDEDHPKLKNPLMNWKRHIGLKGARSKLERLLKEVRFRSLP